MASLKDHNLVAEKRLLPLSRAGITNHPTLNHSTTLHEISSPPKKQTSRRPVSFDSARPISPSFLKELPEQPRNTSSCSSSSSGQNHCQAANMPAIPTMKRAYSSPAVDSTGRYTPPLSLTSLRPASPLGRSARRRSPLRTAVEEPYPSSSAWSNRHIEPRIPEHAELDINTTGSGTQSPNAFTDNGHGSTFVPSSYHTVPRTRRAPPSPLYRSSSPATIPKPTSPIFGGSSNFLNARPQAYANEPYPPPASYSLGSASSLSSTPTSFRSRSPSISSLETIPDSPDAEKAALSAEKETSRSRISSGDGEEGDGGDSARRSSLESRFGNKEKRKRWSVCGAERRADFSLEVIEE